MTDDPLDAFLFGYLIISVVFLIAHAIFLTKWGQRWLLRFEGEDELCKRALFDVNDGEPMNAAAAEIVRRDNKHGEL